MSVIAESTAIPEQVPVRTLSLDTVLGQCTMVKAMIEASVQDLARVNDALEHDVADPDRRLAANHAAPQRTGFIDARLKETVQLL